MEQDHIPLTALDQMVGSNQEQLLKALIPYLPPGPQQFLSLFAKAKCRDNRCDHSTVDRQTSLTQIKYLQQIVLVPVPCKHNIIDTCPDQGTDNRNDRQIEIIILFLTTAFCLAQSDEQTHHHRKCERQSIKSDLKTADMDALSNMTQVNVKIWEIDVHIHTFLPFFH